ncbi:MAG: TatD family hydrolase [Butyrivibrio sp.]|nr:TatD family hydrolase [Butyrivibrio sp.]
MPADSRIFDTHAHYDDSAFDADREALLAALPERGIGTVVNIGADRASSRASAAMAQQYDYIYAVVGVHPESAEEVDDACLEELRALAAQPRVLAIGEIGLDYHYDEPARPIQQEAFRAQLALAQELSLPVMIHSRDAAEDTLRIMQETHYAGRRADIHCFSYSVEMAAQYLSMGYDLGIGGVLTFKNGRKLREVVAYAPLDRLLLETDAPYLAPTPHRGERNDSSYLPLVVAAIAEIKGVTEAEVIEVTTANARRFYGLSV